MIFLTGYLTSPNRRKIGMGGLIWAGNLQHCYKGRSEEQCCLNDKLCGLGQQDRAYLVD